MKQPGAKIIFWGTPEFAVPLLEGLWQSGYKIVAVVTNPDEVVGRKRVVAPPPIKVAAEKYGFKILQPRGFDKSFELQVLSLNPDIFIVAAYGKIIPKEFLEIPKLGALNVHPSLLPKYRGASPIQAAILAGDEKTGVTLMLMDEKMDHGPIIAQIKIKISPEDTLRSLAEKLVKAGVLLLKETLPEWLGGKIKAVPQNHDKATFVKVLKKEDGLIDWSKPAEEIERMVRAYHPWPGTFILWKPTPKKKKDVLFSSSPSLNSKGGGEGEGYSTIKVKEAEIVENSDLPSGLVFKTADSFPAVACGSSALKLLIVQPEGKKDMPGDAFLRGYPQFVGTML